MAASLDSGAAGEENPALFDYSDDLTDYDAENNGPRVLFFTLDRVSKPFNLTAGYAMWSLVAVEKEIRIYIKQHERLLNQLEHQIDKIVGADAPEVLKEHMLKTMRSAHHKLDQVHRHLEERHLEIGYKQFDQCVSADCSDTDSDRDGSEDDHSNDDHFNDDHSDIV